MWLRSSDSDERPMEENDIIRSWAIIVIIFLLLAFCRRRVHSCNKKPPGLFRLVRLPSIGEARSEDFQGSDFNREFKNFFYFYFFFVSPLLTYHTILGDTSVLAGSYCRLRFFFLFQIGCKLLFFPEERLPSEVFFLCLHRRGEIGLKLFPYGKYGFLPSL